MRYPDKTNTTSKYYGVCLDSCITGSASSMRSRKAKPWIMYVWFNGRNVLKHYATEREAALAYDRFVLEHGLDKPLNILKRKQAA